MQKANDFRKFSGIYKKTLTYFILNGISGGGDETSTIKVLRKKYVVSILEKKIKTYSYIIRKLHFYAVYRFASNCAIKKYIFLPYTGNFLFLLEELCAELYFN